MRRLLAAGFTRLSFAIDFIQRPNVAEENVAFEHPWLTVGPVVLSPQVKRNQVVRLHAELFKHQQLLGGLLFEAGRFAPEFQRFGFAAIDAVGQAITKEPKVIAGFRLETHFLERREALIPARRGELQLRFLVRHDDEIELIRNPVAATSGINQGQKITTALRQRRGQVQHV